MELRARAEKLADPRPPTAMPPVSKDTALISELENDTQTNRFLRGVMCFLAFLVYMLSVFQIENYAGTIVIHVIILLLSLCGEVCLFFIYRIKARFSGFTNPAMSGQKSGQPLHVNVLHSPHLGRMCLEMLLWIIQSPPGVPAGTAANILDSFILLRSYVIVLYFSQLSSRSVFKRAIATLGGIRFDSSFALRYNFLYHSAHPLMIIGFVTLWLCLALLHAKAEVKGFGESVYFCFNTATFVGFGDYAPRTFTGRISAFFSFCLGLVVLAWFVAIAHNATKLSKPEKTMRTLFYTNKLCAVVPGEAARVVQRAWKLYVAKKERRSNVAIQFNAFWLTAQAASFRVLRREFAASELDFLRATFSFEDTLSVMTPASSRASSPATTPRSTGLGGDGFAGSRTSRHGQRRPYSMFQAVRSKESQRSTPCAADLASHPLRAAEPAKGETASLPEDGHEGTQAPRGSSSSGNSRPLTIQTGFAALTADAAAIHGVFEHLSSVESQLDELILRVQRISHGMTEVGSPTELAS